ncbi:hypothetical protein SERLA73DRAFT_44070, partial [Serpula lacrymans var. lacrymans S7.3]
TIPFIIMDIHGRIVLWYLPGILTEEKQQSMCGSLQHLKRNMESKCPKKPSKSWRQSSEYYKNPGDCQLFPGGLINLSSVVQLGHESLHKSTLLGTGELWLQSFVETRALMSAILHVAHPALYGSAQEVLITLSFTHPSLPIFTVHQSDVTVLKVWSSVFNVLSIISNQEMPVHLDCLSKAEWYDMLASIEDYNEAILELTGAGFCFKFDSGTITAFSGKFLNHGVSSCSGEGIYFAYYMREYVHTMCRVETPGWSVPSHDHVMQL